LVLLTLVFVVNSIDRSTVYVILEPIRKEFHLRDSQLGLLTGLAYGATYAVFALPLGRLVDSTNRRNLLAALLAIWSVMTAACGLARNFSMLVCARMVVGGAESGGSPASNSMISDLFPPNRRATAVAIFFLGPPAGATLSFLFGGAIAASFGWRATFLMAGVPGLILSIGLLMFMRHPDRGASDGSTGFDSEKEKVSIFSGLRSFFTTPVILCVFCVITISTLVSTSFQGWFNSILIREHGLDLKTAGEAMALCSGVCGGVGVAISGRLADAFAKGDQQKLLLFMATTMTLAFLFAMVGITASSTAVALVGLAGYAVMGIAHLGPGFAVLLNATPNRSRGAVIATLQVSANFIGAGLGPWITGSLSDHFAGSRSLSNALAFVVPLLLIAVLLTLVARSRMRIERLV
jgi:predicted MFS family arabinose efflux permease